MGNQGFQQSGDPPEGSLPYTAPLSMAFYNGGALQKGSKVVATALQEGAGLTPHPPSRGTPRPTGALPGDRWDCAGGEGKGAPLYRIRRRQPRRHWKERGLLMWQMELAGVVAGAAGGVAKEPAP